MLDCAGNRAGDTVHAVVPGGQGDKAERRAARELVGNYHEAELAGLLDHVREGFRRYDAGELGAFELDELIHRYKRSTRELWKFCVGTGGHVLMMARVLEDMRARGELPDWWEAGRTRRERAQAD
jgi:hypothetical protein